MKLTGSEILAEVLIEQGVDTIFGYPGGAVLNIFDTLYKYQDKITHVLTAHEQGASHAADGYARATGKTGVVLATSGPGATNLVTGIATAYLDSIPMVAITGNVPNNLLGRDAFQEIYITGITMPITKHNYLVTKVEDLADTIREAFRIANTGRKGPVLIDIPKDVTAAKCEYEPVKPIRLIERYQKDLESLRRVANLINKAQKPLIYFGGGVGSSQAEEQLMKLVNKAGIPATYTMMAAGLLPDSNPLNLGMIGMHGNRTSNHAVSQCDALICIGARFSDRVALNPNKFAMKATIAQIDIDGSEMNKNVLIDYSLVGDIGQVLDDLIPLVEEKERPQWIGQIREWQENDYHPVDCETELKPHQVMRIISETCGEDTVYVTDVGQHQMWAAQFLNHAKPRSFISSGGLGTMGYGYGAAIGACCGVNGVDAGKKDNNKPVIHITGDGSFHMNLNEGCTAVSYDLPIITVIMNNQVLGMVRQWQTVFYEKRYSHTDPCRKTDFVKLAEAFGAKGFHASNPAEFQEALNEALKVKGPVWIECAIAKDEKVLPMIPAGGTVDDIIMS
ncbi:MAG: biosynthetic-type acetolactate synthase large subunit [Firmicutes bacterium]|nr:biosynthetic-type acetolactate synthase large subunit [Bacillota bacterium]